MTLARAGLCVAVALCGCGRIGYDPMPFDGSASGGARDTAPDRPPGSAADGSSGGVPDLAPEAAAGAGVDVPPGLLPDAPPTPDAVPGAASDVRPDVTPDTSPDLAPDSPIAEPDAAPDLPPDAPPPSYCEAIPPLAAAPVFDGVVERGLALQPVGPVGWGGRAGAPMPGNVSARFAAAWRPDSFYVFIEVTDPDRWPARDTDFIWCGDSAEIYIDDDARTAMPFKFDEPGTRQILVAAPLNDTTDGNRASLLNQTGREPPWRSSRFISHPIPGGYTVEAEIVAADLGLMTWPLAPDRTIGFDIGINVSYTMDVSTGCSYDATVGAGRRLGQFFLHIVTPRKYNDARDFPYANPEAFCASRLLPP